MFILHLLFFFVKIVPLVLPYLYGVMMNIARYEACAMQHPGHSAVVQGISSQTAA